MHLQYLMQFKVMPYTAVAIIVNWTEIGNLMH